MQTTIQKVFRYPEGDALFAGKIKHNGIEAFIEVEGGQGRVRVRGHVETQQFYPPLTFGTMAAEVRTRRRIEREARLIEEQERFPKLLGRGPVVAPVSVFEVKSHRTEKTHRSPQSLKLDPGASGHPAYA